LQTAVAARGWTLPIIMITAYGDVPMAVRAMQDGALDFLQKPFGDRALLERVEVALSRDRDAYAAAVAQADVDERIASWTPRESEVMALVVAGRANKVIATELGVTSKTVEAHRAHVMQKMRARSLAELVQLVLRSERSPRPRATRQQATAQPRSPR